MTENLDQLNTEIRNPETMNLDELGTLEVLNKMNQADQTVAQSVHDQLPQINEAVKMIITSFKRGGRLIYMGAGTSGRLGVLDASECVPTFGVSPDMVVGLIAGGETALTTAVEGAEDSPALGEINLKQIDLSEKDTVVGIAASGRTPYVIGGLKYADQIGAKTVSLACNPNALISQFAQVAIEVNVGNEILTGSTRLKAGTAQKMVLNMLSTTSMVGIGKVYQNLMVDVQPTNEKLIDRALRIIQQATDADEKTAVETFEAADQDVKVAIVMLLIPCDATRARTILKQNDGYVRKAIEKGGNRNG